MLNILLILLFIRPFISSLAFPSANLIYSSFLGGFLLIWIISKGLPIKEIKPTKLPLLFFMLSLFISIIFSANRINSLGELYKYTTGILILLVGISLPWEDRHKVIRVIILAGFVISIIAIYQYFFGFAHLTAYTAKKGITDPFVMDYMANKRIFFPFITPNTLAGYLILIAPLTLIIKGKEKWLALVTIFFAILLTKSVGALLSLMAGVGFYLYLKKKITWKKIVLLAALLAILIFVAILRQSAIKEYMQPIFSLSRRVLYWKDACKIILSHFFTGVGIGNFNLVFSRYAHNSYLQLWAEAGFFGIASFLWLLVAIFKTSLQNLNNSPHKKEITYLAVASFIFLIHNLMDFTFFLPEVGMMWWVILGLLY